MSAGVDYAEAQNNKFYYYYGHEAIDEKTGEWKFIIRKGDKIIYELINSQLTEVCDFGQPTPERLLLTGILTYLSR